MSKGFFSDEMIRDLCMYECDCEKRNCEKCNCECFYEKKNYLKSKGYEVEEPKKSKLDEARELREMLSIMEGHFISYHASLLSKEYYFQKDGQKIFELYEEAIKELQEQKQRKFTEKEIIKWFAGKDINYVYMVNHIDMFKDFLNDHGLLENN